MDAPPVQYAVTSDGVSVAWSQAGDGPDLLDCGPTPFTHARDRFLVYADYYEAMARSFRVTMFDARGTGMSERDVTTVSSETLLLDVQAVIKAAGLEHFIAFADVGLLASSTALRLAAALPDSVTHIALESPYQNMQALADTPIGRTTSALAEADWNVYVQTIVRVLFGWDAQDSEWLIPFANAVNSWVDPDVGLAYVRAQEGIDTGDLLPNVQQPTLVLWSELNIVPAHCSQRIAARVPGAHFQQYADPAYLQQIELVRLFAGQAPSALPSKAQAASGTAVILFTDIVSSTELTERMGDVPFREASRSLDAGLRAAIREADGAAIEGKLLGDGVLATFPSAAQAIDGARRCLALSAAAELGLHIGLHAGDVIREENNVYGGSVNIASRICGLSRPGEILVSDVVRGMARSSAGVVFEDRGEHVLKGIGEAVRVYAVRGDG